VTTSGAGAGTAVARVTLPPSRFPLQPLQAGYNRARAPAITAQTALTGGNG